DLHRRDRDVNAARLTFVRGVVHTSLLVKHTDFEVSYILCGIRHGDAEAKTVHARHGNTPIDRVSRSRQRTVSSPHHEEVDARGPKGRPCPAHHETILRTNETLGAELDNFVPQRLLLSAQNHTRGTRLLLTVRENAAICNSALRV